MRPYGKLCSSSPFPKTGGGFLLPFVRKGASGAGSGCSGLQCAPPAGGHRAAEGGEELWGWGWGPSSGSWGFERAGGAPQGCPLSGLGSVGTLHPDSPSASCPAPAPPRTGPRVPGWFLPPQLFSSQFAGWDHAALLISWKYQQPPGRLLVINHSLQWLTPLPNN